MTRTASAWQLYGATGIHWLPVAVVLIAVLVPSLYWLCTERRRQGAAGRALPWTWTVLVVLSVWLLWQPVLGHVQTWTQPTEILVVIDGSSSMGLPLAGDDPRRQLTVAALWQDAAVAERPTVALHLTNLLRQLDPELDALSRQLRTTSTELAQGIPLGRDAASARDQYTALRGRIPDTLESLALQVSDESAALAEPPDVTPVTTLLTACRLPELSAAQLAPMRRALSALQALREAAAAALPLLESLQSAHDLAYLEGAADALAAPLTAAAQQTRRTLALRICQEAGQQPGSSPPAVAETDLYGTVAQTLRQAADTVSTVVLLSDGGHNTGGDSSDVARQLAAREIEFIAIGTGFAAATPDYAIIDAQPPRLAKARRSLTMPVTVKVPAGATPIRLRAESDGAELGDTVLPVSGTGVETFPLNFKAPASGRHMVTVRLVGNEDDNAGNDAISFVLDTSLRQPKMLIVGRQPDWDSVYLYQAAKRAGLDVRQVFHEAAEPPPRGSASEAIPKTVEQWAKFNLVVLKDDPFDGFDDADAAALGEFVHVEGGSLILLHSDSGSYLRLLGAVFGFAERGAATATPLRVPAEARHLPPVKVCMDPQQAARLIAALGPLQGIAVPPQDQPLLTDLSATAVASLGFHGRGRVYCWGARGLRQWRTAGDSAIVDRLLTQLVADAAAPTFHQQERLSAYPMPAVSDLPCRILADKLDRIDIDGESLVCGDDGVTSYVPRAAGYLTLSASGVEAVTVPVTTQSSIELLFHEFNAEFLQQFAAECGGRYVGPDQAVEVLREIQPRQYQTTTSARYPLARHWSLLVAIVLVGTLHWTLRKISGMAI